MDALNRFANIFWHYAGAILGIRQRVWPLETRYSVHAQLVALMGYGALMALLILQPLPELTRLGLALILFSPQWLYIAPLEHPVFEFRGYGMAAGIALILASLVPVVVLVIVSVLWAWRSYVRRQIIIQPLAFWELAREENGNGSKL